MLFCSDRFHLFLSSFVSCWVWLIPNVFHPFAPFLLFCLYLMCSALFSPCCVLIVYWVSLLPVCFSAIGYLAIIAVWMFVFSFLDNYWLPLLDNIFWLCLDYYLLPLFGQTVQVSSYWLLACVLHLGPKILFPCLGADQIYMTPFSTVLWQWKLHNHKHF